MSAIYMLFLSNFISKCRSRDTLQHGTTFTIVKSMTTEPQSQIQAFWSFLQLPSYLLVVSPVSDRRSEIESSTFFYDGIYSHRQADNKICVICGSYVDNRIIVFL